ncbi:MULTISPECIES: hypothetical protein [Chryseobacterium]|uniref:hypothetical protein n=1 Tax=Chryseobacterium TaxID=59732 RepID=UPI001BEBD2A7|nr:MULTISPECIES: hypothetical protein [Chryseobacterium]MBT2620893.1 hypothetical protein [Chryseobacterium sp. ISL-6]
MKFKYALMFSVLILALTPLFARDSTWRIIFEISCFILFFLLAIIAWKRNERMAFIAYVFLILTNGIQVLDKGDNYFFVQIILLIIMLILGILEWSRAKNKSGID